MQPMSRIYIVRMYMNWKSIPHSQSPWLKRRRLHCKYRLHHIFALLAFSTLISVTMMRAPLAPKEDGPNETAPPCTFYFGRIQFHSFCILNTYDTEGFIQFPVLDIFHLQTSFSHRFGYSEWRCGGKPFRRLLCIGIGKNFGKWVFNPSASAFSLLIITNAAAPSFIVLALAAAMVSVFLKSRAEWRDLIKFYIVGFFIFCKDNRVAFALRYFHRHHFIGKQTFLPGRLAALWLSMAKASQRLSGYTILWHFTIQQHCP